MTYIDFHFPTFPLQPNSLNGFLLSHSTTEYQLALPIVVPPFNLSYTFLSEPGKQIDTGLLMSLPSEQAQVLPDSQWSRSTEQAHVLVQILTRLIDAFIPKLNVFFELKKHKDNSFELRFNAASK